MTPERSAVPPAAGPADSSSTTSTIVENQDIPFRPRVGAITSLVMVVACVTVAEVLMKMGANATSPGVKDVAVSLGFNALGSWYTIVGIVFHVAGFGAWIYTLKSVPLSLAFNFTSMQQVIVPLAAWGLIRGEHMSLLRLAGIGIVVAGVLLLVPAIVAAERKTEGQG